MACLLGERRRPKCALAGGDARFEQLALTRAGELKPARRRRPRPPLKTLHVTVRLRESLTSGGPSRSRSSSISRATSRQSMTQPSGILAIASPSYCSG